MKADYEGRPKGCHCDDAANFRLTSDSDGKVWRILLSSKTDHSLFWTQIHSFMSIAS